MYVPVNAESVNMNRYYLTILGAFVISFSAFSQYDLEIEITGLRNDTGVIMLQLFDEHENVIRQEKGDISEMKCNLTIADLKPGKYAIRYFHDENLNGTLETTRIGKPTEGYGFSNNAYGMFGPKPFKEWLFEIKGAAKLVLATRY
jgi:uncharacterized protein (DUF2141 family)